MKAYEDLLQERLEQLEAGEPLENCLQDLPEEVACSLNTAARLSALEWPAQDAGILTAQRAKAVETRPLPTHGQSFPFRKENKVNTTSPNKPSFWKKGYRLPALFAGAAALVLCLAVIAISTTLVFSRKSQGVLGELAPVFGGKSLAVNKPSQSVIQELHGVVEVMESGDKWQAGQAGDVLKAGIHIRTGALSSATLAFYDGSQVVLGPGSELALDLLNAGQGDAERVIVFTQTTGESEHQVASSKNLASRYEVQTPAGTGTAKGTEFSVSINPDQGTLFQVNEGEVEVTGSNASVLVESGQATVVNLDEPPAEPTYFFTGQGQVTMMGSAWVIDGQVLRAHAGTVVIGNPQIGDEAFFEGRVLADSTRLLDLVVLVRRSPANRFSMTGFVEEMGDFWKISGQLVAVTDITLVDAGIEKDDLVEVTGLVMSDGTLQAETIRRLENAPGLPFDFTGVVQALEPNWRVSDKDLVVDLNTEISPELEVGNLVRVTGWILDNGVWQATHILRVLDETSAFEFTGPIDSMDPWVVAGVPFSTREWTLIEADLEVNDQVRVKGQVMANGEWVAFEIRRLEDLTEVHIVLVGILTGKDPWVVSGVTLNLDSETVVAPGVAVGMLVRVEIEVLEDGTWKVIRIDPMGKFELADGCQEVTAVVVSVSGSQIQLEGWPVLPLGEGAEVVGDLQPDSVVVVQICYGEDGTPEIVYIYIILEPGVIEPPDSELPGHKVEICHKPNGKNPHVIVVSQSAVPAHLGHGDYVGSCR